MKRGSSKMDTMTNVYDESKTIIQNAIRDKKLVIFVGAGASVNSGIPLWPKAVEQIKARINPPVDDKENDLLKIPQFYYNSRCEKEYIDLIKEIFNFSNKKPNDIHRKIFDFNPSSVITTNYDDFLERAAAERGIFPEVIEQDSDISYTRSDNLIIKMHGGFKQNNFVFKEDDYLNYSRNFPLIETYIKAIFAAKVVLFVGYSYNDPDTKQLFNLIKSILRENFQQAYMINASDTYDENISKYYKYLGINVLYYQKLLKDSFDSEKIYDNTLNFLDYLLSIKQPNEISDKLYADIVHFNQLNYINSSRLSGVLSRYNATVDNNIIILHDSNLLDFFKSDHKTDEKFTIIKNVLEKAGFVKIVNNINLSSSLEYEYEEVYTFSSNDTVDEFYDFLYSLDYIGLKNYIDGINIIDDSTTNEEKYKVAHGYYELGEYTKCYSILKQLSGIYRREGNPIWLFITEFNKVYLGKLVQYWFNGINEREKSKIKLETQNIDLLALSAEYSGKYNSQIGEIMKYLLDFNFVYSTLYNVISSKETVEEQANTRYIVVSSEIEKLNYYVCSFYNLLQYNHFFIGHHSEVVTVFKQYVESVFCAMSRKQDISQNDLFVSKNVVLLQLPKYTILFAVNYLKEKELNKLFNKYEFEYFEISDDTMNNLLLIFNNLTNAALNNSLSIFQREKLFNALKILSYINLSLENLSKLMDSIIELEKASFFYTDEPEKVHHFLWRQYNLNKFHSNHEKLDLFILTISQNLNKRQYENVGHDSVYYKHLFGFCCNAIREIDPNFKANDLVYNDKLFSIWNFTIPLYKISSDEYRQRIHIKTIENLSSKFSLSLYKDAVFNEIVTPTPELEDKLHQYVQQIVEKRKTNRRISFPDPVHVVLEDLLSLRYEDKLLSTVRFNEFFSGQSDTWNFLYNMESFNYCSFDLKWLKTFGVNIKKQISQNKKAKTEIYKLFQAEFANDNYDQELLEDFVKYFL